MGSSSEHPQGLIGKVEDQLNFSGRLVTLGNHGSEEPEAGSDQFVRIGGDEGGVDRTHVIL